MYKERIDAYLESKREEMIEDVKTLVRINSQRTETKAGMPYGTGCVDVLETAVNMMQRYGLAVRNYENYVVTGDYGPDVRVLDILAHLDVVPANAEDWTVTAPFDPVVVDGKIYGRGTSDDKGPAVAALYAIRAIRDLEIPLVKGVRLILGSDEECGSSDLDYYYRQEQEALYSFTPDADFPVINIEKGRLAGKFTAKTAQGGQASLLSFGSGDKVNVVPAKASCAVSGISADELQAAADFCTGETKVSYEWREQNGVYFIQAKGMAAHASTPELGNNALTGLLTLLGRLPLDGEEQELISRLNRLFPHGDHQGKALGVDMEDEASGRLTITLSMLHMEEGSWQGEFDCRAPICANDDNLTGVIRKRLAEAGVDLAEGGMIPAHHVPEDSRLVRTLLDSYERYTGIKGKPIAIGGGTYVHNLERGVAFGCASPDVDNHMHGDDEFMLVDALVMSAKIFADAIVHLCAEC